MNKYFLSLIASCLVISVSFVQCDTTATKAAQVAISKDSANAMDTIGSQAQAAVIPIVQPPAMKSADFTLKSVKASIEGSSTLHDWASQVTKIEGKGTFLMKDNNLASIKDVEIKIAVKGIKSKEGSKMDKKTYEAFKSDKNPNIIYAFSNAVVKINAAHVVAIEANGKLSMAGTSKEVALTANGKELANGDLQLSVSQKIKMTDFKMVPPVMFLGTIKVGDEITVHFDFILTQAKPHN